jgi:hypothetical protein
MKKIVSHGQVLFGVAILALGIENLICAHFRVPDPGVPWFPVSTIPAYINGVVLSAAGLCIAAKLHARWAAIALGYLFVGYVLLRNVPLVFANLKDWTAYGVLAEAVALGSAAWMLAQTLPPGHSRSESVLSKATVSGRYAFAACLVVFGSIHFIALRVIASLIPAWIPGSNLFWALLTGTALVASGISIAFRWLDGWAGFLLGIMFLLWVVALHAPRVAADLHNPDEWSSALIAFAMAGASWIAATLAASRSSVREHFGTSSGTRAT